MVVIVCFFMKVLKKIANYLIVIKDNWSYYVLNVRAGFSSIFSVFEICRNSWSTQTTHPTSALLFVTRWAHSSHWLSSFSCYFWSIVFITFVGIRFFETNINCLKKIFTFFFINYNYTCWRQIPTSCKTKEMDR